MIIDDLTLALTHLFCIIIFAESLCYAADHLVCPSVLHNGAWPSCGGPILGLDPRSFAAEHSECDWNPRLNGICC